MSKSLSTVPPGTPGAYVYVSGPALTNVVIIIDLSLQKEKS